MMDDTKLIVVRALKQALRLQIGQLFDVLMSAPDTEAGLDRFQLGVHKAVALYEEIREALDVTE